MTYLLTRGAHFVYCLQLPNRRNVSHCRCPLPILDRTEVEPPLEQQCRACHREIKFANSRPTKPIRRLSV